MGDLVLDLCCFGVESYTHSMIFRITCIFLILLALDQQTTSVCSFLILLNLFTIDFNCIILWRVSSIIHLILFASIFNTRTRIYTELGVVRILLLLLFQLLLILLLLWTMWFLLTWWTALWQVETFEATLIYRHFCRFLIMVHGLLMIFLILILLSLSDRWNDILLIAEGRGWSWDRLYNIVIIRIDTVIAKGLFKPKISHLSLVHECLRHGGTDLLLLDCIDRKRCSCIMLLNTSFI